MGAQSPFGHAVDLHEAVAAVAGGQLARHEWAEALAAASDSLPAAIRPEAARVCLSLIYGLMADAHIGACDAPDLATISRQACGALNAYLESLRKD